MIGSLAILATAVVLLAPAGTARATCYSSTPNSATFTDLTGDATTAPDIGNTNVSLSAGCGISINPALPALNADQGVATWINTDGDTSTGDTGAGGADRVVLADTSGPPGLYGCSQTPCELSGGETVLSPVGNAGFATDLNQLGVLAPTTLGILVESIHITGTTVDDFDFAPDGPPPYAFPVSFSTTPPSPPPPPPPPPPSPPSPATTGQASGCKVPKVKGKSLSQAKKALAKAGCKYRTKGKGKVVSTNPKAGSQTTGTVQVKAKAKKKRKRHSSRVRRALRGLS